MLKTQSLNYLHKNQDDYVIGCLVALARKLKQATHFYVTIDHKRRNANFQEKGFEEYKWRFHCNER